VPGRQGGPGVKLAEMTIDRNAEGAWRITALVGSYYVTRCYYGFTRRESVARFRAEMKGGR
jgi:hypothetical protein